MDRRGQQHRLTVQQESLPDWWDEGRPLFEANAAEVETDPLAISQLFYYSKDRDGSLLSLTARWAGALVGYAIFQLLSPAHHATTKVAMCDVIYVSPAYRGRAALMLIQEAERIATAIGMHKIVWTVKVDHDWSKVLLRRGYQPTEKLLTRRLY